MTNKNNIERLFKAHYEQMHRIAAILLHDEDLSRDIVHDVFASLLDTPQETQVTGGYLLRAVRNRCLNHIRNCEIHDRIESLYFLENGEYEAEDWPDDETIARIYAMIESELSPKTQNVIRLRFTEGLPFAKVAASMGISETAVFKHLKHALTIIRQKLSENG